MRLRAIAFRKKASQQAASDDYILANSLERGGTGVTLKKGLAQLTQESALKSGSEVLTHQHAKRTMTPAVPHRRVALAVPQMLTALEANQAKKDNKDVSGKY